MEKAEKSVVFSIRLELVDIDTKFIVLKNVFAAYNLLTTYYLVYDETWFLWTILTNNENTYKDKYWPFAFYNYMLVKVK